MLQFLKDSVETLDFSKRQKPINNLTFIMCSGWPQLQPFKAYLLSSSLGQRQQRLKRSQWQTVELGFLKNVILNSRLLGFCLHLKNKVGREQEKCFELTDILGCLIPVYSLYSIISKWMWYRQKLNKNTFLVKELNLSLVKPHATKVSNPFIYLSKTSIRT